MSAKLLVQLIDNLAISIDPESGPFEGIESLRLRSSQISRMELADLTAHDEGAGVGDPIGYVGGDLGVV